MDIERSKVLLSSEGFLRNDPGTASGQYERVGLLELAVGAPMFVISGKSLSNSPKYELKTEFNKILTTKENHDNNVIVRAKDVLKKPGVSIFYVSVEDNITIEQLRDAMIEFTNFYSNVKEFQLNPNAIYFFFPYLCLDMSIDSTMPWIPAYMSCCRLYARFVNNTSAEASAGDEHAEMALERGLAYRFVYFGKTPWVIPISFKSDDDKSGTLKVLKSTLLSENPVSLPISSERPYKAEAIEILTKFASEKFGDTFSVLWGETKASAIEPEYGSTENDNQAVQGRSKKILGIAPPQVGLTTVLRQATKEFGSGFTEDGKDRRTKTYNHHMRNNGKDLIVAELGVNASGRKGLRKMLMMAGTADSSGGDSGFDLVLFVCSLDDYDRFTNTGENLLTDAVKLFDTVQRSVKSGTPSFVIFNKADLFREREDVEGMCQAMFADYSESVPPIDYFKNLFKAKQNEGGKIEFAVTNALDSEDVVKAFTEAFKMLR